MSRALNDLDARLRPLAVELIAQAAEHGIPVVIVDVLRTPAQQAINVAAGVSWTLNSRHLPQPPDGKSLAIDLAPYAQFQLHGGNKLEWNDHDPAWQILGTIGQSLGLKWGVVDAHGNRKDLGHFELVVPQPAKGSIDV